MTADVCRPVVPASLLRDPLGKESAGHAGISIMLMTIARIVAPFLSPLLSIQCEHHKSSLHDRPFIPSPLSDPTHKQTPTLTSTTQNTTHTQTRETGTSALHLSIAYRNNELFELLLQLGVDVNERASGTFFMPADQQQERLAKRKREQGKRDSGRVAGPLFHADRHHKASDFSGLAYFGEFPLAWAAAVDDKMMYNALISHGGDPNLQDSFGNMILHVVVARQRLVCRIPASLIIPPPITFPFL